MKFERTKNSARNVVFGVVNKVVAILFPLITRTLVIRIIGAQYAGLSGLFSSVLSVLNMSELGLSIAVIFCLYKPVAADDKETIDAIINFLRKIYLYVGSFILGVGLIITPFLKYFIAGSWPKDININILFLIYLVNTALSYFAYAYKDVLFCAYQRKDISHNILTVAEVIQYIAQIIIIICFKNYYLFALMLPISTLIVNILNNIVSKKMFPDIEPKGELDEEYKTIIKKKVFYFSFTKITATLVNSIDNIVISGFIGLTAITIYGNYNYISTSLIGMVIIVYVAVQAAVGNGLNTETEEKNNQIFSTLFFMSSWIAMFCSVSLICLYQPFMELWLGKEYLLNNVTMVLMVVCFYINVIRQFLSTAYINAAGIWNKTVVRQIATSLTNLILDIMLVKKYGITGVVFATFLSTGFIGLPMDIKIVYKYILNKNPINGYQKLMLNIFETGIISGVVCMICSFISIGGFGGFIIKGLVCLIVSNGLHIGIHFKNHNLKELKQYIIMILKRRV